MNTKIYASLLVLGSIVGCGRAKETEEVTMQPEILYKYTKDFDAICKVFPLTAHDVQDRATKLTDQGKRAVDAIIAIPDSERTFENTARALDTVSSNFSIQSSGIATLGYVSPDDVVRDAAHAARVSIGQAAVDIFGQNVKLYKAFKAYYEGNARTETLTPEERYFLDEAMKDYKRSGLDLPDDKRAQVTQLQKDIGQLTVSYGKNIDSDCSTINATAQELDGVDTDVLEGLKRTDDGKYIVGVDTPTFSAVMEHCTVAETRKRLSKAYQNRAYPANMDVLDAIIAKRDQLAQLLGYKSYAHLNIDDEIAQTPEIAQAFITELIAKADAKADREFEQIKTDLAPSVTLSPSGKMYPWDGAFASAWYKKKHYQLDEREVSEYFPMQQTIDRLLNIYETFFDLTMTNEPIDCLWIKDLTLVKVRTKKDNQLIGYLILDLHPRPNKYGHACQIGVSPSLIAKDGTRIPALAVVLANFPKATPTKPALLQRADAKTFFHEFGHAIHTILGATHLASHAGTSVKTDFVELPSQMLEEWMYDKDILKQVTGHYKTGQPLSDNVIDTIIELKNFGSGKFVLGQSNYALLSLGVYGPGERKDTNKLVRELHERILKNNEFDPESHFQAAFGHLTGYGARYYGYMWSKVYALDLFDHIKKFGLLNPVIGTVYGAKVLGKGGSVHPLELIKDFLGREPNQEAFLKDLGL